MTTTAASERCVVCDSPSAREIRPAEITRLEEVSFNYSFSPAANRTFRAVRCEACTHVFCTPLPEGVAESYEDVVDEEYLKHALSRRLAADEVVRLIAKYVPAGRLLDVGCATGDFLAAARDRGYAVEGLELSRWSCDIARGAGLTIHQQTLAEHAGRNPSQYDVVSLIGVIEHFSEPRPEMTNIAALLRPGGLAVIWTGDVDSPEARLLGHKWWHRQGQHIQYFTHRSLRLLAERAGLEHVTTARYPWAATHETVSNSLRRYRFHRLLSALAAPLFMLKPVIYLRLPGELLFLARWPS